MPNLIDKENMSNPEQFSMPPDISYDGEPSSKLQKLSPKVWLYTPFVFLNIIIIPVHIYNSGDFLYI